MALFVRRLNQSSFHDTSLRPSQDEAFAETIPLGYYNRSLEVDQSSEETSRMVIHADFQGRYDHVFEKAPASRDQRPMPSHASSSTSRSSAIVPNASCRDPSMSPSPAPSLQWQEFHTSTAPEGRPEFYRTASKRRRSIHDVDGPHTGSLGCKKRRLRRELITSRLSRPFSSPATHILNREAAAGGKRFLKMAAAAAARKVTSVVIPTPPPTDWDLGKKVAAAQVATVIPANNIHPLAPAEMVRRAAIMNRFRIRVCDEARQRGDRTDLEMTASAALLRASTGHHGVGFVADPRASVRRTPADSRPNSRLQQTISTLSTPSTTTSASRWATTSGTVVSRRAEPQQPSHNYRTSRSSSPGSPSKAVRPLDSRCPSPRLRPLRSPERPAVRNQDLNSAVDDDQLLTFSATDYSDDFADPDDGEIYTDFSLIFGGSGGEKVATDSERDPVEYSSGADEHFEDYMDDLDGIPWDAR